MSKRHAVSLKTRASETPRRANLCFVSMALCSVLVGSTANAAEQSPPIRLVRTISLNSVQEPTLGVFPLSGSSNVTWSPDGEKLAVYVDYNRAIEIWNRDGSFDRLIKRNCNAVFCYSSLAFINGHRQLLMGATHSKPLSELNAEERQAANDLVMSVYDMGEGKIVHQVEGHWPDMPPTATLAAESFAVSPDQAFVAVTFVQRGVVDIYSTRDWQKVISLPRTDNGRTWGLTVPAFSKDSALLAVAGYGEVRLFATKRWQLLAKFVPFSRDKSVAKLSFSPSGLYLAVGASAGNIQSPIRIARVEELQQTIDLNARNANFLLGQRRLAWSDREKLIYLTNDALSVYDPADPLAPIRSVPVGAHNDSLALSPDGTQVAVNYIDGIKIFQIEP